MGLERLLHRFEEDPGMNNIAKYLHRLPSLFKNKLGKGLNTINNSLDIIEYRLADAYLKWKAEKPESIDAIINIYNPTESQLSTLSKRLESYTLHDLEKANLELSNLSGQLKYVTATPSSGEISNLASVLLNQVNEKYSALQQQPNTDSAYKPNLRSAYAPLAAAMTFLTTLLFTSCDRESPTQVESIYAPPEKVSYDWTEQDMRNYLMNHDDYEEIKPILDQVFKKNLAPAAESWFNQADSIRYGKREPANPDRNNDGITDIIDGVIIAVTLNSYNLLGDADGSGFTDINDLRFWGNKFGYHVKITPAKVEVLANTEKPGTLEVRVNIKDDPNYPPDTTKNRKLRISGSSPIHDGSFENGKTYSFDGLPSGQEYNIFVSVTDIADNTTIETITKTIKGNLGRCYLLFTEGPTIDPQKELFYDYLTKNLGYIGTSVLLPESVGIIEHEAQKIKALTTPEDIVYFAPNFHHPITEQGQGTIALNNFYSTTPQEAKRLMNCFSDDDCKYVAIIGSSCSFGGLAEMVKLPPNPKTEIIVLGPAQKGELNHRPTFLQAVVEEYQKDNNISFATLYNIVLKAFTKMENYIQHPILIAITPNSRTTYPAPHELFNKPVFLKPTGF